MELQYERKKEYKEKLSLKKEKKLKDSSRKLRWTTSEASKVCKKKKKKKFQATPTKLRIFLLYGISAS